MNKDSEKYIEPYLKDRIESLGGKCPKWVSPGNNGVPDRIILLDHRVAFAELKTKGKKLDPMQVYWEKVLKSLGLEHYKIDNIQMINDLFPL